jgi:hypothetical protein
MKATAPTEPQICSTSWTDTTREAPALIGFASREHFPAGLQWSGSGEVPAVGQRVRLYVNSMGEATVKAYFHHEGFLGVLVAPDQMPAHLRGVSTCHAYGIELEPRRLRLSTAPTPADVSRDWIPDYPETAEAA